MGAVVGWRLWRKMQRCDCYVVKEVLFQLSFVICGPMIWWLVSKMPSDITFLLAEVSAYAIPFASSFRALLAYTSAVENANETDAKRGWFESFKQGLKVEAPPSKSPEGETMRRWLTYWSCSPIIYVSDDLIRNLEVEHQNSAFGIFVAAVLWIQFWNVGHLVRYLYRIMYKAGNALFGGWVYDRFKTAVSWVMSHLHLASLHNSLFTEGDDRCRFIAAACVLVIFGLSLLLEAFEIMSMSISVLILMGATVDSLRCAEQHERGYEDIPSKLAFWLLAVAWCVLINLPGLSTILTFWTPLVLVVSHVLGVTALGPVLRLMEKLTQLPSSSLNAAREPLLSEDDIPDGNSHGGGTHAEKALDDGNSRCSSKGAGMMPDDGNSRQRSMAPGRRQKIPPATVLQPVPVLPPATESSLHDAGHCQPSFSPSKRCSDRGAI